MGPCYPCGGLDWVSVSQLWLDSALVLATIWGMNEWKGTFSSFLWLCLSTNKQSFEALSFYCTTVCLILVAFIYLVLIFHSSKLCYLPLCLHPCIHWGWPNHQYYFLVLWPFFKKCNFLLFTSFQISSLTKDLVLLINCSWTTKCRYAVSLGHNVLSLCLL